MVMKLAITKLTLASWKSISGVPGVLAAMLMTKTLPAISIVSSTAKPVSLKFRVTLALACTAAPALRARSPETLPTKPPLLPTTGRIRKAPVPLVMPVSPNVKSRSWTAKNVTCDPSALVN